MADDAAETVTISKRDHALLTSGYKLLSEMNANPEARPLVEKAVKAVRPDVETEDERAARTVKPLLQPVLDTLEKVNARFDDDAKRRAEAETAAVEQNLEASFGRLRSRNYTDDGIEKIKALMVEKSIPDPEVAAAYFEKMNPPAKADEAGWTPQQWDLGAGHGGDDLKALFQDEDRWADQQVGKVLAEMRGADVNSIRVG